MANVVNNAVETYAKHMQLLLISSISFVIAVLIPLFASFPTYGDAGAIYIRTASIFSSNLTLFTTAIIVVAVFFSLLFLSFAMVAINVIVKHSRTYAKIKQEVFRGLEKYTSRVFVVLLILEAIVLLADILAFAVTGSGEAAGITTAIVGLAVSPLFFYAPASIVIDENNIPRAMKASLRFFKKRFDYVFLWLALAIALITIFDLIFILIGGAIPSAYFYVLLTIELVIDSVIVLPFLIVLQSECYMKRFAMLKH